MIFSVKTILKFLLKILIIDNDFNVRGIQNFTFSGL